MANVGFTGIGVMGSGQMGSGIAQVCATSGYGVTVFDLSSTALERAQQVVTKSAEKLESKGIIDADQLAKARSISFSTQLADLGKCDLVIEAIVEDEAVKREAFANLAKIVAPDAVIATNTSSLPITRLATAVSHPERFVGMHFMNPVPLMKLVEVIHGLQTSESVTARVKELAGSLGKEVTESKDYPGFVVNRVLMPMINEAFSALMEGVAGPEDIDKAMKLGTNQPMGPLALADFIGLDTCLAIIKVLHEGFCDPKYRPSPLMQQYVDAGWLGRKTGKGVYSY